MTQRIVILLFGFLFLPILTACTSVQPRDIPEIQTIQTPNQTKENILPSEESSLPTVNESTPSAAGIYIPYSESAYNESSGKKRVLFFHATWCPYCKGADKVFSDNLNRIPADVVLLKTDYDTQKSLKTRYGVTYQHTFVYIDADGEPIKIWNGGDIDQLIANTK